MRRLSGYARWRQIFRANPKRGAEYLGEITLISILLNEPREAAGRARLAIKFGKRALKQERKAAA